MGIAVQEIQRARLRDHRVRHAVGAEPEQDAPPQEFQHRRDEKPVVHVRLGIRRHHHVAVPKDAHALVAQVNAVREETVRPGHPKVAEATRRRRSIKGLRGFAVTFRLVDVDMHADPEVARHRGARLHRAVADGHRRVQA